MPRRQRPSPEDDSALARRAEKERQRQAEMDHALVRELIDYETAGEPLAGEGVGESGTIPGSVGGTTGDSKRAAGQQAPGATAPPIPGIDPERARHLVGRRRLVEGEAGEESTESAAGGDEGEEPHSEG